VASAANSYLKYPGSSSLEGTPAAVQKVNVVTAVDAVADVLREEILGSDEATPFLGMEDDLLARLGVSRPTLRQAIRLLQAEGILTVRRGHGGGLYGARPTSEGVAHMASVYLRTRRASFADISRSHGLITTECARLAALDPDPAQRARLLAFVDAEAGADRRAHAKARAEWGVLLSELAGSPTLLLFEEVLAALADYRVERPFQLDPDGIARTRAWWRAVAEAVRDGDVERTVAAARVMAETVLSEVEALDRDPLGW
jgi:DNA-binding FadR family transcriptional regulator